MDFHFFGPQMTTFFAIAIAGYFFIGRTPAPVVFYPSRWANAAFSACSAMIVTLDMPRVFLHDSGLHLAAPVAGSVDASITWLAAIGGGFIAALALVSFLPTAWETNRDSTLLQISLLLQRIPMNRSLLDFNAFAEEVGLRPEAQAVVLHLVENHKTVDGQPVCNIERRDGKVYISLTEAGVADEVRSERIRKENARAL